MPEAIGFPTMEKGDVRYPINPHLIFKIPKKEKETMSKKVFLLISLMVIFATILAA